MGSLRISGTVYAFRDSNLYGDIGVEILRISGTVYAFRDSVRRHRCGNPQDLWYCICLQGLCKET